MGQGVVMSVVNRTVRYLGKTVNRAAEATTATAGAVGGAAVNGVMGGVTGAAEGIKRGISSGSHSTPAAALALGALGVAGLVDWPVLLAIGGGALLLQRMNRKPAEAKSSNGKPRLKPVPAETKDSAQKATDKATDKQTAKTTNGKRPGTAELRGTN